jgi:GTP cyclohydrolase I
VEKDKQPDVISITSAKVLDDPFSTIEKNLRRKYYGWEGAKQFDGTGDRLRRAFDEFCWTSKAIDAEITKALQSEFVYNDFDEMLVEGPIETWTLCPHHLLPCKFTVYVGYIPSQKVLGLSKFARIAVALSKRPVMQEMYTKELAEIINVNLAPVGVGVFVIGKHGCMTSRGIKQDASVTTSVLLGAMRFDERARTEFFRLANGGNCK